MSELAAPSCASGTPGLGASPRPWTIAIRRTHDDSAVYYLRILDAKGNRVADLYPHESVGGRGLEQVTADAQLIVALANSPAADAVERETTERRADPVEIPAGEQAPLGGMERLL